MVYLVKLWVDYAHLDRQKCFYLVKGGCFYLVKGGCFYLVKGFALFSEWKLHFLQFPFFLRFLLSEKANVRLDAHRFGVRLSRQRPLHRAYVLASVGHNMESEKHKRKVHIAFLVRPKVNFKKASAACALRQCACTPCRNTLC